MSTGLVSVAYGSTMSKLTYKTWDLTLLFAEHKDFDWFEAAHAARSLLPMSPGTMKFPCAGRGFGSILRGQWNSDRT